MANDRKGSATGRTKKEPRAKKAPKLSDRDLRQVAGGYGDPADYSKRSTSKAR